VASRGAARSPFHPRCAHAPERPHDFTLATDVGDIDLLGELIGVGGYAELARDAAEIELTATR